MEYAFAPSVTLRNVALSQLGSSRQLFIRGVANVSRKKTRPVERQWCAQRFNIHMEAAKRGAAVTSSTSDAVAAVPVGRYMTSRDIRETFLSFYASRGHTRRESASLVPDDPSILLTIAGMVPFKPVFLGIEAAPDPPRATSSQKCVRTNDIENVGVTKRHHTFFEMLGNFSFGDYFKRQAIEWAWELLTNEYKIPAERLVVSVFEEDDEAFGIWRDVVGIEQSRICRMGAKDNFWASGQTGPCGPCSEIYFDFDPLSSDAIDLEDDERFIELYNLVFMQFSRASDGSLHPLDNQNIDTGMGLERMAQVLQRVQNNYETDLIRPIMDAAASAAGISYDSAPDRQKTSLKVIGDHARAVTHLIADGVRASNVGRGYVLRRLLRRIVRHGRILGIERPFVEEVIPVISNLAVDAGIENVREQFADIVAEVTREEQRFLETLERGESMLAEIIHSTSSSGDKKTIKGEDAFELYDTYGFPLELTEEIAAENGFSVDRVGFDSCMLEQRHRARAARGSDALNVEGMSALSEAALTAGCTDFQGYERTCLTRTTVTGLIQGGGGDSATNSANPGDRVRLLMDQTPFYAEGGGQVGDTGYLFGDDGSIVLVEDTKREAGAHVHIGVVEKGRLSVGDKVRAEVNVAARRRIKAHHTATHLLQAALKIALPQANVSQAGSLVDADRLRFDFNCPKQLTEEEIIKVESLVNSWIEASHDTVVEILELAEAKRKGAVAMFGEKYGDTVRVIDVPGVSMELCGGTHVSNTAEIGLFKIVSESGPSSGVRRIEAVCGAAVLPYLLVRDGVVKQLCGALKAKPEELPARVRSMQEELRVTSKELASAKAQVATAKAMTLVEHVKDIGGKKYLVERLDNDMSADSLKAAVERLSQKLGSSATVLLASSTTGKVSIVCSVGEDLRKSVGLHAGKLVGEVAKVCGGGGGGKPNLAQAGGRDASKVHEALRLANELISSALQGK